MVANVIVAILGNASSLHVSLQVHSFMFPIITMRNAALRYPPPHTVLSSSPVHVALQFCLIKCECFDQEAGCNISALQPVQQFCCNPAR